VGGDVVVRVRINNAEQNGRDRAESGTRYSLVEPLFCGVFSAFLGVSCKGRVGGGVRKEQKRGGGKTADRLRLPQDRP
jgi:hypothetical protein